MPTKVVRRPSPQLMSATAFFREELHIDPRRGARLVAGRVLEPAAYVSGKPVFIATPEAIAAAANRIDQEKRKLRRARRARKTS
jgi:hypothetical protein